MSDLQKAAERVLTAAIKQTPEANSGGDRWSLVDEGGPEPTLWIQTEDNWERVARVAIDLVVLPLN